MNMGRWSLRTRITALCALAAAVLAVIAGAAAATAVHNRHQTDFVFNQVASIRQDSDELLPALLNQETGIRGYAINGSPDDLAPYTDGVADEARLAADMTRRLASYPALGARVQDIETAAAQWRTQVAQIVIAQVQAGDLAGARDVINSAARDQFDALRAKVAALQAAISDLRDTAVGSAQHSSALMVQLLVAAALVVVVAGVLLALSLRLLVTGPVEALARQVRLVAAGDYAHGIDDTGPPELRTLGRDVNEMRGRIVADLQEVRRARSTIEEANSRLESQAAELVRSNRDLEQFAYVASHDLQEPLRKVSSFCQLLQRRYAGQLDERADQYIYFAVDGAQRMQRLINDLLAFSRIGRHTAGFVEVDLTETISDAVSQLESSISRNDAEVTWDPLPVVHGEQPLLAALLGNLVSNSIKFRRPEVPPRIHLSAQRVGEDWEISCQDNGIGIEREFADKVFIIFQRLHSKEAYPGTGIGLAISKKIVEYHGGHIWLDSAPAEGTLIKFTLPVPVREPQQPADAGDGVTQNDGVIQHDGATSEQHPAGNAEEPVEETV